MIMGNDHLLPAQRGDRAGQPVGPKEVAMHDIEPLFPEQPGEIRHIIRRQFSGRERNHRNSDRLQLRRDAALPVQTGDGVGKVLLITKLQQVEQDGLRPAGTEVVMIWPTTSGLSLCVVGDQRIRRFKAGATSR